jgi:hypothetical protein
MGLVCLERASAPGLALASLIRSSEPAFLAAALPLFSFLFFFSSFFIYFF